MPSPRALSFLGFVSFLLAATTTLAAPKPEGYSAFVDGNTVTICPHLSERGCPQPEGMLRQDVATGAVLKLPKRCVPFDARHIRPMKRFQKPCYVDQCVPPGIYRYGYGRPLDCSRSGVAYYFTTVKVEARLAPDCLSDAPLAPVERAPWNKAPIVCSRGCCRVGGTPKASDGVVALLLALLWFARRRG